ncbi:MAG: type IV pilus modification protein PilV [Halobacteria archaeon]|nr:type IV pilus modification protein PilV [Halobacteria archaeon]
MRTPRHNPGTARGFGLIEVLVAVLILSIGLLGLASLQTNGMRFNHTSYLRTQATVLAYDIVDAMRANRGAAGKSETALGGAYQTNYTDGPPTGSLIAEADLRNWKTLLTTLLPTGRGQVSQNGRLFTINVEWTERGGAPTVFSLVTSL